MKKVIAIVSIISVITGLSLVTATSNHETSIHNNYKTAADKNIKPGG